MIAQTHIAQTPSGTFNFYLVITDLTEKSFHEGKEIFLYNIASICKTSLIGSPLEKYTFKT